MVSSFRNMYVSRKRRLSAYLLLVSGYTLSKSKKTRRKRLWAKEWLIRREERGAYRTILNELNVQDSQDYRKSVSQLLKQRL